MYAHTQHIDNENDDNEYDYGDGDDNDYGCYNNNVTELKFTCVTLCNSA